MDRTGEYINRQQAIPLDGLGDLITVEHAARLLKISPDALDKRLRRHGWLVYQCGQTRLIALADLSALAKI